MRDRIVEMRKVRASELIPHPRNWRTHPKKQQDALRGILEEIGLADAVLVRETPEGLQLIDGHLRRETLGDEVVSCLVLDVNEAEAEKLLLTLDPLAAMAGASSDLLTRLLADVNTSHAGLQKMLEEMGKAIANVGAADPDAVPEAPKPNFSQGATFELGSHVLMCGDSTKDVSKLLGDEKPNLMVTDPPYGVNYDPAWRNNAQRAGATSMGKRHVRGARSTGIVANDERADWTEVWKSFSGDVAYVWHGGLHAAEVQTSLEAAKFQVRGQIIWAKTRMAISRGAYHWQHEPCWYAVREGSTAAWVGDRSQTTLWMVSSTLDAKDSSGNHSTQKPVELFRRPMLNHTKPGDAVFEPFCGSGSCLIAGEQTGRRVFAMEIDPAYVAQTIARWEAFTGKKAKLR